MEENFEPVAQTRANYYTPGSPVQFVCVELLKGSVSGEHAVCLTFKNISRVTLTALEIHFKCKGADGVILCEDNFEYRGLNVQPGESFGMDDAVFVTAKAITSVDVSLKNVYNGKRVVHLDGIKRVRLPAPKRLSPELQAALEARMNRTGMKYQPQILDNGWYCACGAFHPKEEDTVYCSECGSDRILLQNALNTLLQPQEPVHREEEVPAEQTRTLPPQMQEEPTRVIDPVRRPPYEEATRVIRPQENAPVRPQGASDTRVLGQEPTLAARSPEEPGQDSTRVLPGAAQPQHSRPSAQPLREEEQEEEEDDRRDTMAEALIRWVPPITAVLCAGIALWGFVYYQFFL